MVIEKQTASNFEGHPSGDLGFDPWIATTEQALKFSRTAALGMPEPLAQRAAAREILEARSSCLAVDGGCRVLHCLKLCFANGLTPPAWLRDAFIQRHNRVVSADVKTWDEAFGSYWPRRTRLGLEKQKIRLKKSIHTAAWNLVLSNPKIPIRRDFFDLLCEINDFGKGASTVEAYYYECVRDGLPNVLILRPSS